MMLRLDELWRLQEIDSAIDSRRATMEGARARLGDSDELLASRAQTAELALSHGAAISAQKDLDVQAEDLKSRIAPAEEKLYSGAIKNPKELTDLQQDVEQLKRQLTAIEDRDIDAMSAVEQAETELRQARAQMETLDAAWRAEQAELTRRIDELSIEVSELESSRTALAALIEPSTLKVYDHVRRAHQGRGAAKLDRNLCLGCRISLPISTVNKARAGSALVQCPNCERILCA
jgi:predicted  nucleic acid-binding Zn-ribbon protein